MNLFNERVNNNYKKNVKKSHYTNNSHNNKNIKSNNFPEEGWTFNDISNEIENDEIFNWGDKNYKFINNKSKSVSNSSDFLIEITDENEELIDLSSNSKESKSESKSKKKLKHINKNKIDKPKEEIIDLSEDSDELSFYNLDISPKNIENKKIKTQTKTKSKIICQKILNSVHDKTINEIKSLVNKYDINLIKNKINTKKLNENKDLDKMISRIKKYMGKKVLILFLEEFLKTNDKKVNNKNNK